jgi:hypothetical protein
VEHRGNRDRIIEALRLSALPLDDDELSRRTGIEPRQTVNQICRALDRAGAIRRLPGPAGKLVNQLVNTQPAPALHVDHRPANDASPKPCAMVTATSPSELPPGSSAEQRAAERVMLDLLGERLKLALNPLPIYVPTGARVEIDGADEHRSVLVECWAHQGAPKSAQKHKVLADALKLTWIASTMYPRPRLILCLSDPLAAAPFVPNARSWAAQALVDLGVSIELVELPHDLREGIIQAQQRQYR